MPTYVYECEDCGVRFERLQSYSDAPLQDCPECNGHVHRVIQPVGVIFKGSGFYVTDNKGKSSTGIPTPKKEEGAAEKKADGASSPSDSAPSASATSEKAGAPSGTSTSKKDD